MKPNTPNSKSPCDECGKEIQFNRRGWPYATDVWCCFDCEIWLHKECLQLLAASCKHCDAGHKVRPGRSGHYFKELGRSEPCTRIPRTYCSSCSPGGMGD
jgi:hypothetical protein